MKQVSTAETYAAFLRGQGFSPEQVAAMVARSFNRSNAVTPSLFR